MKKLAFTLAEILITLAIIGIVAAITIPNLATDVNDQANAAKLSATITELENGFAAMLNEEEKDNLEQTELGLAIVGKNTGNVQKAMAKYFKTQKFGTTKPSWSNIALNYDWLFPPAYADKCDEGHGECEEQSLHNFDNKPLYVTLKSGAIISINAGGAPAQRPTTLYEKGASTLTYISDVFIDVNGSENPNKYGRDVFAFCLGGDGMLYPYGGLQASLLHFGNASHIYTKSGGDFGCTGSTEEANKESGLGCTARLIENGFKFDY